MKSVIKSVIIKFMHKIKASHINLQLNEPVTNTDILFNIVTVV